MGFKTLFADAEICVQPPYRFPQLHPKRMQGKVPWLRDMTWAVDCLLQKYVADILRKLIVEWWRPRWQLKREVLDHIQLNRKACPKDACAVDFYPPPPIKWHASVEQYESIIQDAEERGLWNKQWQTQHFSRSCRSNFCRFYPSNPHLDTVIRLPLISHLKVYPPGN